VLSTLVSGMITMTSLVVSITVVLTLAATQLGPRLIGNFMADHAIKAVLGHFIGTILYLLTLLRSLSDDTPEEQVPHLAITVGTALSILCLFALLSCVHKVARSIIPETIIRDVARTLRDAVDRGLPRRAPDHWRSGWRSPDRR
jgi:uncharacterized membrane protein